MTKASKDDLPRFCAFPLEGGSLVSRRSRRDTFEREGRVEDENIEGVGTPSLFPGERHFTNSRFRTATNTEFGGKGSHLG